MLGQKAAAALGGSCLNSRLVVLLLAAMVVLVLGIGAGDGCCTLCMGVHCCEIRPWPAPVCVLCPCRLLVAAEQCCCT
jgi:hypothetical protein